MAQLGYDRYVAQGGDWGAIVTRHLGESYADRLIGVHFNMLFAFPDADDPDPMGGVTEAELARFGAAAERISDGTGYMAIQSTKPQTLSYGLTDSPTALAAWILEKFQVWSDLDDGGLEATYGWDRLLDNVDGVLGHQHRRLGGAPLRRVATGPAPRPTSRGPAASTCPPGTRTSPTS